MFIAYNSFRKSSISKPAASYQAGHLSNMVAVLWDISTSIPKGLDMELDSVPDVPERFIAGIALGDAAA